MSRIEAGGVEVRKSHARVCEEYKDNLERIKHPKSQATMSSWRV